MNTVIFHT